MPSSSGDTTSSDTADSSSTLEEMFCAENPVRKLTTRRQTMRTHGSTACASGCDVGPGRWRIPQAGTCGPPACWDIQPPGRRCALDTEPPRRGCSSLSASPPCSGATWAAGPATSGNLWRSWSRDGRTDAGREGRKGLGCSCCYCCSLCLHSVPVHEIYQHLRVLLVLLHLDGVREDHVQVKHKVLDLKAHRGEVLELLLSDTGGATERK